MIFLKKVLLVGLMALIPAGNILSQVDKGDKELSAAASFAHLKYGDSSLLTFRLAGRLGFFISDHFEIEPEFAIGKVGEDLFDGEGSLEMGYVLSCNLAYHFTPDQKRVPFILAGFGLSNAMPFFHNVVTTGMKDRTYKVINAGAGIKLFTGKCFAVRLEYRFQHFFAGGGELDIKYTYHYGLVGISVFLK